MKLTIIMVVLVALSVMGVALAQETQMAQKPFNAVSNFLGRFGRPKDPAIAARQDYEHAVRAGIAPGNVEIGGAALLALSR